MRASVGRSRTGEERLLIRRSSALFEGDLAVSGEITLAAWRRRGIDVRMKELFGRIWEYWL